ncbi:hypothetical protein O181_092418 [Austropuccinia psidii MF-1]|uniref:Integrase catalytic domain-containing protein n=1 Tax=Austropuccinia psidii MF-1 TaxID=1389203 RepID=A0A9Q3IZ83_9BASI|nr:hypothetical protein [Austropuccinia psidii MF-1]
MPPDIMAYSILGKISRDSNAYNHVIDSMVLTMNASINPQLVLDKLSELLQHKNTKDTFQKGIKTEKMDSSALLTNSTDYPYKLTYVCHDGKHNPKNTTHKPENCWAEHPKLRLPPRNINKKKSSKAKTHQTGFEALLSHQHSSPSSSSSLVIDCGATHHMFSDKKLFTELVQTPEEKISTSDPRSSLTCKGRGTVKIDINNESITLHDCLYVPNITNNLVSLLDLCSKSITIIKDGTTFQLLNDKQVLLKGQIVNKLMTVNFNQPRTLLSKISTNYTWHQRLGHPGNQALKSLGLKSLDETPCEVCVKGKMTHLPFKGHFSETTEPLNCLHMGLVGPISPSSISGHCYILTIIDQHTSYKITCFLKNKSDTYEEFVKQQKLIETTQQQKIKKLVTEGGGEFINQQFKDLAEQNGFKHILAPPYTLEHNGIAERANRTILDKARCLLLSSCLPNQYWAEAVNTATYLTKILPTSSKKNLSPYFLWTNQYPKDPWEKKGYYLVSITNHHPTEYLNAAIESWDSLEEDEYFDCQEDMNEEQAEGGSLILNEEDDSSNNNEHSSLESCLPPAVRRIKIIGPQHPTLINSDITEENILPY